MVKGFRRIVYSVYQYPELLDSSNMCMRDWRSIAEDIWVRLYYDIHETYHYLSVLRARSHGLWVDG